MVAVAFLAGKSSLFLLQMTGILENQGDQSATGTSAVDGARESLGDQAWQKTRMIQMGMGHQNRLELMGFEGEPASIALLELLITLIETAIDKNTGIAPFEVRAAPRHRSAGSAKRHFSHLDFLLALFSPSGDGIPFRVEIDVRSRQEVVMTDNVKDFEAGKEKQTEADAEDAKSKVSDQLDKARDKFAEVAGEVEKKAKAIGGSAGKASQQVKESAEKASAAAKEKYGVAKDKVIVGYDKARKDMDTLVEDVNEYTRDNPGKAVLIAAGVGFVLGMLIRPRHHD
jgi:ElaB/YqjD/DUF883 family membrane-anchored ribosome-binding protein